MASSVAHDLGTYLKERRAVVDGALERLLPPADLPPALLHEAMRHSVFSGGKRLRPILTLAACEMAGAPIEPALAPACATELIHTYSLIHDDLPCMDDDELRRGRPTCHVAFDEATAVLAGDGLLTLAFGIVASAEGLPDGTRLAIIRELAAANGDCGMVGGQVADMEAEGGDADGDVVRFIHENKTGKPLRAAVVVGALVAGMGGEDIAALSSFGAKMGLAFQIADDLLDLTSTEEEMGKAVGKDAAHRKATYPAVAGVDGARDAARELLEGALTDLERFGEAAWALRAMARFIVERRH